MICPKLQGLLVALLLPMLATAGCNQSNSTVTPVRQGEEQVSPPSLVGTGEKEVGLSDRNSLTSGSSSQSRPIEVVTTFLPMYWFTKAVAGNLVRVEVLLPPGTEVHEYQATPKDVQAIAQADVLVKNGLGLEEFLENTIKNARNTQLKQIEASRGIKALQEISPVVEVADKADRDHKHEHSAGNPHVWLDPILAIKQVENIRDGLIAADPRNKVTYQANATAYIQQLQALDREFQQRLQQYPNCTFVTFHDAYPYLAQRYQLKQVAVVQIPEDQLSPGDIQKTISTVKQYKVKALFGESGTDNKLLKNLSQDLKLNLSVLDSLESGPVDPQHYFTAMKANLQTLESACR
ncbi:metal ABC transporter substrate-binding protein [Aerosakkonema funiforme]|uniref:metal ABC transporter substrate-binding protein n=1 Tax=Aerosakkonema funiforme TaxID=1246630 RepID=UPI0035BB477E